MNVQAMKVRRAQSRDASAGRALTRKAYAKWLALSAREPDDLLIKHVALYLKRGYRVDREEVIPAGKFLPMCKRC